MKSMTDCVHSPEQPKPIEARKRQRFSPIERRRLIVAEAIQYFSEVGFDGSTRELALRLGVKQPLLYRYFPSKEDLVKEVYETVYIGRWRRDWDTLISDREVPLRIRLMQFYSAYAQVMFQPEWIRIFFFSGLKGMDINKQYVTFIENQVLKKICAEIRFAYNLPSVDDIPIQPGELAAFWIFHGGIFYYGVRREVYKLPVHVDLEEMTELSVDSLLAGFPQIARRILAAVDEISTEPRSQRPPLTG